MFSGGIIRTEAKATPHITDMINDLHMMQQQQQNSQQETLLATSGKTTGGINNDLYFKWAALKLSMNYYLCLRDD